MYMRGWMLYVLLGQVCASAENKENRLARDMYGKPNKVSMMEVRAGGQATNMAEEETEPAQGAEEVGEGEGGAGLGGGSGPTLEENSACAQKIHQCTDRCILMLEYYVTDVASKFEGLELVSVPETDEAERAKFYLAATKPLFNEAAFLYCGMQRCFESLCKNACPNEAVEQTLIDNTIADKCQKVQAMRNAFVHAQMTGNTVAAGTAPILPKCDSVCGDKEDLEFGVPGHTGVLGLAVVAALFL